MQAEDIPADDDQLLAQCDVETFRSGGRGGQHAQKNETAVRLRHLPSGITAACQNERSLRQNIKIALRMLREKLQRLTYRRPKRHATKMPRSVRQKILRAKKVQGEKKQQRRRPSAAEE